MLFLHVQSSVSVLMQEHLPNLGAGRVQLTCAERQQQRRRCGTIAVPPILRTVSGTMWWVSFPLVSRGSGVETHLVAASRALCAD